MPDPINNERFRKLLLAVPGKAIEFLYDSYYHQLLRLSKSLTRNHEVSVDIVQDTLIYIWENYYKLGQHHDQSIQHYLVRVVRYKSISFFKANIRIEERLKHLNGRSERQHENSVEAQIIEQEILEELRQLISTFPRREKECLLMKIDGEMTTAQIAATLNVSSKAVERSITSANKRLRRYWEGRK